MSQKIENIYKMIVENKNKRVYYGMKFYNIGNQNIKKWLLTYFSSDKNQKQIIKDNTIISYLNNRGWLTTQFLKESGYDKYPIYNNSLDINHINSLYIDYLIEKITKTKIIEDVIYIYSKILKQNENKLLYEEYDIFDFLYRLKRNGGNYNIKYNYLIYKKTLICIQCDVLN